MNLLEVFLFSKCPAETPRHTRRPSTYRPFQLPTLRSFVWPERHFTIHAPRLTSSENPELCVIIFRFSPAAAGKCRDPISGRRRGVRTKVPDRRGDGGTRGGVEELPARALQVRLGRSTARPAGNLLELNPCRSESYARLPGGMERPADRHAAARRCDATTAGSARLRARGGT